MSGNFRLAILWSVVVFVRTGKLLGLCWIVACNLATRCLDKGVHVYRDCYGQG